MRRGYFVVCPNDYITNFQMKVCAANLLAALDAGGSLAGYRIQSSKILTNDSSEKDAPIRVPLHSR